MICDIDLPTYAVTLPSLLTEVHPVSESYVQSALCVLLGGAQRDSRIGSIEEGRDKRRGRVG